ncbi:TPA: hypothetical protein OO218_004230 [Shigella boydii]|nr:hypothetical protein [Shigella boydii]
MSFLFWKKTKISLNYQQRLFIVKKNSARTHSSEVISIMRYPDNKECVQIVTVRLPEKIRKMCDVQGAFGYFFDFEKIDGVIKLTNFLSVGVYKDGTYCEELDKYMEGLN